MIYEIHKLEDGQSTGEIHFFCSRYCLGQSYEQGIESEASGSTAIVESESADSGLACETCGKYLEQVDKE